MSLTDNLSKVNIWISERVKALLCRERRYFPPDGISRAAVLVGVAFVAADAESLGQHAPVRAVAGPVHSLRAILLVVALVGSGALDRDAF